jgi:hypothetical protein
VEFKEWAEWWEGVVDDGAAAGEVPADAEVYDVLADDGAAD